MKDTRQGPDVRKHNDQGGVLAGEAGRYFQGCAGSERGFSTGSLAGHLTRGALLGKPLER